jgi:AmiR/NasT family two-component response regulator
MREEELPGDIERLRAENDALRTENEHLRVALSSRIVIEQAKGVLVERIDLPPEDVFQLLRMAARRSRRNIHELAEEILKTRVTPAYIQREIGHLLRRN